MVVSSESGFTVRVRGVQRRFGARSILGGVDLDIGAGEFVALLGPSGSGKSTLLRVLAGLDRDASGHIELPARRAVVFQEPRLLPWKRVYRNVVLGLSLPADEARRRAIAALDEVGLSGHADAWPATLSGGEAQRTALARALVRAPELLLLDEPFGALDALTRIRMHTLLRKLCDRHRPAVLLVTHDVDEALLLADRAIVLARPSAREGATIAGEIALDLPLPRRRGDRRFVELRRALLGHLGVADDAAPGEAPAEEPLSVTRFDAAPLPGGPPGERLSPLAS